MINSDKGFSRSMFWIRHLTLAFMLVAVAGVLIYLREDDAPALPDGEPEQRSVSTGLSEFYREFRMSATDPAEEPTGDFVLDIAGVDSNLDARLESMSSRTRPVEESWTGEHKNRSFKAGNTLREAISTYALAEGMQVIWNLNQDFVIKHQFQMDNTVAGSLAEIASGINSSFEGDVRVYLCSQQRSLVVSAEATPYLVDECSTVN
ncbi:TcpQ domain-containing protein [Alteromonas sp. KUL49]|uniref:TcpQ domain-containing protein n=1 Tax=Alteromonas sp. KUL49 TaxID=2480798 RepID=UPI00102EE033|nr:TcpQ domain-containing protein [Alteromonas sp. KUL49]TAP41460.1 hypothetical protein EYS00_04555 [Alteromonas sp. KUL49]